MAGWFQRRPLVSSEFADFAFDCFAWMLRNTRGFHSLELVVPTDEFFPLKNLSGDELAVALFEVVKQHAGMSHWPCRLERQQRDPEQWVASTVVVKNAPAGPAGTFSRRQEGVVISYNPRLDPASLVATFAHELAHYLTHGFPEEPPGGEANHEFATDVGSVFLGFGLFAANSCFQFNQFTALDSRGWSYRRQGYLAEPDLLYALAIFAALRGVAPDRVRAHLKPHLRGSYKRACREVAARGDRLELLKSVKSVLGPAV